MPRYSYICKECGHQHDAVHSYKVVLTDCPECDSEGTLEKMLSKFNIKAAQSYVEGRKAGAVVEESIEKFKDELKQEKSNLSKREYDDLD